MLLIYPLYLFFSYWFGLQAWNLIEDDRERQRRLAFSEYIVADPNTKKSNFNRRTREILKAIEGQGGEEEQDIEADKNGVVQIFDEAQLNVAKMEKLK